MFVTFIKERQCTFNNMQVLQGMYNNQPVPVPTWDANPFIETNTIFNDRYRGNAYRLNQMKQDLFDLNLKILSFKLSHSEDISTYYDKFFIPKSSGGLREINAPQPPLMELMREIKRVFEDRLNVLYHNSAYAYTKGRSTKQALEVHQRNESKWFLKLDVKDFFPSCTSSLLKVQLSRIYPFSLLYRHAPSEEILDRIIDLCMLNGGLPQGTPMSPMLTNLIMIPFDKNLQDFVQRKGLVYTRYADDILLSAKTTFSEEQTTFIVEKMFERLQYPFKIKKEKTRYGSSAGRNWNLGLMLNKDNNITIGYKQKQRLRAGINNFLNDFTKGIFWSIMDVYQLGGHLSYLEMIEPDYKNYIVRELEIKYNLNFKDCVKQSLDRPA